MISHVRIQTVLTAPLAVLSISWGALSTAQAGKPPRYDVVVVKTTGAVSGLAGDVDSNGNIVGQFTDADDVDAAYHYDRASDTVTLLDGGSDAFGMNDDQKIVGVHYDADDIPRPAYWSSPQAPLRILETPPLERGKAFGISDNGIVVGGLSTVEPRKLRAAVWNVAGSAPSSPTVLPALAGYDDSWAEAVSDENADGTVWVAGRSSSTGAFDSGRAVRWLVWVDNDGQLQSSDAEDLGALVRGVSYAASVNLHGDTCGQSGGLIPFLKLDGEAMMELPTPDGTVQAFATDLNAIGETVGTVFDSQLRSLALLWSGGQLIELNRRIGGPRDQLQTAIAIGPNGHICGQGFFRRESGWLPYVLIPR